MAMSEWDPAYYHVLRDGEWIPKTRAVEDGGQPTNSEKQE